ncbi:MAG: dihydroorotase [Oleiphilaceae bacterium]|nr:dihydroorotase [Oleiphilaceae bacterium]
MSEEILKIRQSLCLNSDGNWQPQEAIYVQKGLIIGLGPDQSGISAAHEMDANGCYVFPGLIDLSVSLREPGNSDKGTVATETAAAAAGGVTTLCCPPDTQPVNDSHAVGKLIGELAQASGKCRVLPLGAMTKGLAGEQLSEYASLKRAGCIAVSNGYRPIKKLAVAKRCFEYAKTQNLTAFINPIEPSLYRGSMHEGEISTTIGLQGVSSLAETIAVAQYIQLAKATGVRLHFSQLSCADSVTQVRQAKQEGLPITADVALQNLIYTEAAVANFNSVFHTRPPLRTESDRLALLEGVKEGTIDAITSAHRPHEATAKLMPFGETEPGMSMVEHLLPMAWQLHRHNELPFNIFIRAMTAGPSKVLGESKPSLMESATATLVVFDPEKQKSYCEKTIKSRGKNSPLLGKSLPGAVRLTLLDGKTTYSEPTET